jgi:hypothetical protein
MRKRIGPHWTLGEDWVSRVAYVTANGRITPLCVHQPPDGSFRLIQAFPPAWENSFSDRRAVEAKWRLRTDQQRAAR